MIYASYSYRDVRMSGAAEGTLFELNFESIISSEIEDTCLDPESLQFEDDLEKVPPMVSLYEAFCDWTPHPGMNES